MIENSFSRPNSGFGPRDFDRIWPTMGIVIALGNAFGAFFWGVVTENLGFLSLGAFDRKTPQTTW